jgi:hypothetical protein
MSTSRQDIEIKRAHAILTKERLQKRTEERMSLPIKNLIEYCEDTIVICNAILSWPQCPVKGMFGRDYDKFEDCLHPDGCKIDVICHNVRNLMEIDERQIEKGKTLYT